MIIGEKIVTYRILNDKQGREFVTELLNQYDIISTYTEEEEQIIVVKIGFLVDNKDKI